MSHKQARADVTPIRQRTQYTCMSTSMSMALQALGQTNCDEDTVNRVMGAQPMKGASWEQALACAQHFGMRATLTVPCTVKQLKAWTDRGIPVLIAWNPEGRDWSHASLVFDVDDVGNVWVADPNIPDPEETVRVVPKGEFYSKWFEKWPNYLVRRPAMAIEREITVDGRQVQAGKKEQRSQKDKGMARFLREGPVAPTEKSDATKAMDKARWDIRKDQGMAGLPGANYGSGYHKDDSRYNRKREKSFDREASGDTMISIENFQRILKMASDLPGPVERYVEEVQESNPNYSDGQAWATAWSIYCKYKNPESDHCQQSPSEYFKAASKRIAAQRKARASELTAKFERGVSMTVDEVAAVVGPEFKEMNENPPESVVKVMEEMQGKTAASVGDPVWVVRDPGKDAEFGDIFYKTTVGGLANLILGTGSKMWKDENTALYFKEAEAKKDANARWNARAKTAALHVEDKKKPGFNLCGERSNPSTEAYTPDRATCFYCKQQWQRENGGLSGRLAEKISTDAFAELLKDSKFEEGKPADPTENMTEEDAAEWKRNTEEHKDNFKAAAAPQGAGQKAIMDYLSSHDPGEYTITDMARTMRGVHFKDLMSAANALKAKGLVTFDGVTISAAKATKTADMMDLWLGWTEDEDGNMVRFVPPGPHGAVKRQVRKFDGDWTVMSVADAMRKHLSNPSEAWLAGLPSQDRAELDAVRDLSSPLRSASQRQAAGGAYGFNKMIEGACGAGVNKLQKAAAKIAKNLYARDSGSPSFLSKHAERGGSKTASLLLKAMESLGPLAQLNKTAGRSGTGLYGFSEKTAKLGLAACNDLHHEAGVIAGDLFARKGADPMKVAGYLSEHAKTAGCPYAALLGECSPEAASKVATDFLASCGEEPKGNEEVLDLVE